MSKSFLEKLKDYFVKKRNEKKIIKELSRTLGISESKIKNMLDKTQSEANLIDIKDKEEKNNE